MRGIGLRSEAVFKRSFMFTVSTGMNVSHLQTTFGRLENFLNRNIFQEYLKAYYITSCLPHIPYGEYQQNLKDAKIRK